MYGHMSDLSCSSTIVIPMAYTSHMPACPARRRLRLLFSSLFISHCEVEAAFFSIRINVVIMTLNVFK